MATSWRQYRAAGLLCLAITIAACGGDSPTTGPDPVQAAPQPQATGAADVPTAGSPGELTARSCADERSLRSVEGRTLSEIVFVNLSSGQRKVYWLNYSGQRQLYNTLAPQRQYTQPSYLTHPWVVTDASDTCLGIYVPESQSRRAVLR